MGQGQKLIQDVLFGNELCNQRQPDKSCFGVYRLPLAETIYHSCQDGPFCSKLLRIQPSCHCKAKSPAQDLRVSETRNTDLKPRPNLPVIGIVSCSITLSEYERISIFSRSRSSPRARPLAREMRRAGTR